MQIHKLFLALSMLGSAQAATTTFLDVATGARGTTSNAMYQDIGHVCTNAAFLRERHTSGSVENVDLLLGNKVSLAFVQLDVLKARDQVDHDPRAKDIRTLLPLNLDEIHLISRVPKKGFLGRTSGITKYSDLKGKKLGAWGGSFVTANVLRAKSGIDMQVLSFPERDQAMNALNAGQVDAVLAVVGQPADWVKALSPQQYILAPIDVAAPAIKDFYQPARLVYPQFGGSVPTYGVQRLLVTRNFKTPERRNLLLAYQKCAKAKLVDLQEGEGMHPKWSEVDFKSTVWPMYQ